MALEIGRTNKKKTMEKLTELIENEIKFCNEIDCEKTENDQFIYDSRNGVSTLNLPYVLIEYKNWLIEKKLVKALK